MIKQSWGPADFSAQMTNLSYKEGGFWPQKGILGLNPIDPQRKAISSTETELEPKKTLVLIEGGSSYKENRGFWPQSSRSPIKTYGTRRNRVELLSKREYNKFVVSRVMTNNSPG